MKTWQQLMLNWALIGGLATVVAAQTTNAPADAAPPASPATDKEAAASDTDTTPAPPPSAPAEAAEDTTESVPVQVVAPGEKGLRLNFRNAPLELVLNYLSEAAGFIIMPETDVRGRVDVWSNEPLTRDEAVDVLGRVLSKNGYALLRDGRTLTVVTKDEAKKRDIPVRSGYEPSSIPKDDQIVTQIIPVRFISAPQLSRDLAPLLPATATLTANEGGNALVITDTQASIRRMAEIIKALDTTVSSLSAVRVFQLRYADAKSIATVLRDVFASTEASRGTDPRSRFFSFMRGGGPPGGGGESGANATGRPGASRVVATADERSNALVVSAPDDLMPTIAELVMSVDVNVEDITEIRVFPLEYSDPQEMADLLTSLFPDETNTRTPGRPGGFFRGGPPGAGGGINDQSDRLKRQSRVIAVPDPRTGSVVVTAARDTMEQIAKMIEQLDADPARKQKVFVYELKNAEPGRTEDIVRGLFEGQNTRNTRSVQSRSALENRETQMMNQQNIGGLNRSTGGANRTIR
ncbi:MAG: hypothetical protein KA236_00665 [Verrucomicrobia bacterium]|jgi:general secretion pathway protein D|nr:hypothetical protein [Verrucomicrobiota bacterium]